MQLGEWEDLHLKFIPVFKSSLYIYDLFEIWINFVEVGIIILLDGSI